MLKGLNIEMTSALADAVTIPVIASGGLASVGRHRAPDSSPMRACSPAPSSAAPSMTAGIDPREALALLHASAEGAA